MHPGKNKGLVAVAVAALALVALVIWNEGRRSGDPDPGTRPGFQSQTEETTPAAPATTGSRAPARQHRKAEPPEARDPERDLKAPTVERM
jgi:hypothetical protein